MFRDFLSTHASLVYELSGVFALFGVLIFVGGVLISRFDEISLEDAVYFAFITAFTVGFGDVSPRSRGARIVTVFIAFSGLLLVGITVAIAVHTLEVAMALRDGTPSA